MGKNVRGFHSLLPKTFLAFSVIFIGKLLKSITNYIFTFMLENVDCFCIMIEINFFKAVAVALCELI